MRDSAGFAFDTPEWQEELPSTNTALCRRLRAGEALQPGFVLAVRNQTCGRGRLDRVWRSTPGRDLAFSFFYQGEEDATRLCSLPMSVALGIAAFLEEMGLAPGLKWPNDVRVGSRKIGGILAEQVEGAGTRVVVGVGLNVNMTKEQAGAIDQPATSLGIETGRLLDIHEILAALLPCLAGPIAAWRSGGFAALRSNWLDRCDLLNEPVEVVEEDRRLAGRMESVGKNGELLLRLPDGRLKEIWAGDVVSLRAGVSAHVQNLSEARRRE